MLNHIRKTGKRIVERHLCPFIIRYNSEFVKFIFYSKNDIIVVLLDNRIHYSTNKY